VDLKFLVPIIVVALNINGFLDVEKYHYYLKITRFQKFELLFHNFGNKCIINMTYIFRKLGPYYDLDNYVL
jgi:hypothetical protein